MKDSGIEWIGEIPDEWLISKIGQLYHERNVKVSDLEYPPLSVTMRGIVPQLATAAKSDAHDQRKLVCKGDFAINSRSDRRGSCGISEHTGSVSLINTILVPYGDMNPHYYNWLFHTVQFADEFYKWGHGIVDDLWTTHWKDMKNISIPVPTLLEQQIISSFLDKKCAEIDSIIEKTRESIEEYKKLKQAVITEAVTKGVRGKREMKDSGVEWIGDIPKEWKPIKYKYVAKIVRGGSPRPAGSPVYYYGEIPFMKVADITKDDKMYVNSCEGSIKEAGLSNTRMVKSGTLLLTNSGATLGVPKITTINTTINDGIAAFIIVDKKVDNKFLYYSLKCKTKYFLEIASLGMGQPNLNTEIIGNTFFVLPTLDEQKTILEYLDVKCSEINAIISKKEALLEELETYKKSLIYEYVTGKKRL